MGDGEGKECRREVERVRERREIGEERVREEKDREKQRQRKGYTDGQNVCACVCMRACDVSTYNFLFI